MNRKADFWTGVREAQREWPHLLLVLAILFTVFLLVETYRQREVENSGQRRGTAKTRWSHPHHRKGGRGSADPSGVGAR